MPQRNIRRIPLRDTIDSKVIDEIDAIKKDVLHMGIETVRSRVTEEVLKQGLRHKTEIIEAFKKQNQNQKA